MNRACLFLIPLAFLACQKSSGPAADTSGSQPTSATQASAQQSTQHDLGINAALLAAFKPLPSQFDNPENPLTEDKIILGRKLYYDNRLSKSQEISCNSCHKLDAFGVDNEKTSLGHKGQRGERNSPTVYNSAGHVAQFWDGRAKDVEEQAKGPILNPVEMAMMGEPQVLEVLNSIPEYLEDFKKAFPGEANPITYNNIGKAIGAFERKLVTPSRWDDFLGGKADALSENEKKGFMKFSEAGCTTCHNGALVGGGMFMKLGLVNPWPDSKDEGRFKHTKNEADKMIFKVPSLRNVEKTAPYFHDGSIPKLEEAIEKMAFHQLGQTLSKEDVDSIANWLKTLTGRVNEDYIKKPSLPASTEKTPKPDPN